MFWGSTKQDGSRKLVRIDGSLNSGKYIQLLKDYLIPQTRMKAGNESLSNALLWRFM